MEIFKYLEKRYTTLKYGVFPDMFLTKHEHSILELVNNSIKSD